MTTHPQTVEQQASVSQAAEQLERTGYGSLPVVDEHGAAVGLIGRREIDKALRHGLSSSPVQTYMWKGPAIVAAHTPVAELRRILASGERGPILVTLDGLLVGLVTRGDLLRQTEAQPAAEQPGCAALLQRALPAELLTLLRRAGTLAEQHGWGVYLVGGPVRDLLLDRPVLDLDLVVEGDAIALAQALASEQAAPLRSHEQFRTATISLADQPAAAGARAQQRHLDFVTARTEFYEHPTALPQVAAASLRHDLHRRDFTINTLAICLNPSRFGRLYDFYGGQRDLQRGLIRVLHNLSFIDDPTRILRAARLAARLDFRIEPRTQALIADALEQRVLQRTTAQRIRHEIARTLKERRPEQAIKLLDELGILAALQPGLAWSPGLAQRFERAREEQLPLAEAYLLLLCYDLPDAVLQRLASGEGAGEMLTARQRLLLRELAAARLALPSLRAEHVSDGALDRLLHGRDPLLLHTIAVAEGGLVAERSKRYLTVLHPIPPLLTGRDLQALGLRPGPRYGELLRELRVAQLDGQVGDRDQALAWVRERII